MRHSSGFSAYPSVILFWVLFLVIIIQSSLAYGAKSDWIETPQAKARLLIAAVEDGPTASTKTLKAGLEITMDDGWKTYWRTPGAAGIPPKIIAIDNSVVQNIALYYPAPLRLDFQGFQLYGYEKRVIFPLDLTLELLSLESLSLDPATQERSGDIALDVRILICRELCIPVSFKPVIPRDALPSDLSQNGMLDVDAAFEISQFISQIPRKASTAGVHTSQIQLDAAQKRVEIQLQLPKTMQLLDLFPELTPEPELDAPIIAAPQAIEDSTDQLWRAQFPIQRKRLPSETEPAHLVIRTQQGDFSLNVDWQPLQKALTLIKGNPVTASHGSAVSEPNTDLWLMLLMALVGGFILNFMPCVLPVLSIKVLHLIKHSELSQGQIRRSFIATAAGIVSSFMLLAAVLIALKASGQAIGWGIQFQQPLFIGALALIVVAFAGNLWGLFEFRLPLWVAQIGNKSHSTAAHNEHSLTSSFAQGVLATLLATPCSAPFLGTAIGFAFSQDNQSLLLIFLALGVGLALPYLLMTLKPTWVYKLPKPGRWMLTLKRVLGTGLLITAGWLFWVLSDLIVLTGVVAIISLALLWWLLIKRHRLLWALPIIALALIPWLPPSTTNTLAVEDAEDTLSWVAFEPSRIDAYVADGHVVFIDITARWCVTCMANKIAVINTDPIQQALSAEGVVPMRGDWTRPDSVISQYLSDHQRFGIPFNAVYGPGAPNGILLGEILSKAALLSAIERAKGLN
ncbi:protein-disulfide reductase DsbD family protein [Oceanospirillum maris]|uniref:protein-disulfide reductase DsbD family protein n=1 Tax=Oceanospirillum maris TaxID=64977 RepID=UPI0004101CA7|nr:protein-disulfide reductase DsbD domain-containing protein [Oceanospirillum maris]